MTHFIQLPNKTVSLLDQELAMKDGNMTFEFGGTEKVLVTETALQNAIAGMSAPITVATKTAMDALTNDDVEQHKRIFVQDDGDGKWAYYMVTDVTGETPAYIKVSDEDIFGALFSDDVTAQISKIGHLEDLNTGLNTPATIIEALNEVYAQHIALDTRVGVNDDLTTVEKGTLVAAMNELVVNITSNDGDILTIQNNIGDLATINLTDALDKATVVAAINKVLAVQATKLDAEDVVPIIVSYTGLLTELTTTNKNSLVEAINEIVADVQANEDATIAVTGELANLVTENKTNLVSAINEVHQDVIDEATRATGAEATLTSNLSQEVTDRTNADNTLQSNLDTEAATRAANDGDLATLTTDVKSNLVNAINEVDANTDAEVARATATEGVLTTNLNTEISDRTTADTNIQTELDATQVGAGLGEDGAYTADATTNYINTATSLNSADKILDTQAKANQTAIENEVVRATAAETANAQAISDLEDAGTATTDAIQAELDATQVGAGLTVDGAYVQNTEANYIATAVTLSDADNKLDAQAKVQADALTTEEATRLAADQTLQGNIDTTNANLAQEVTDRTVADNTLQDNIDAEAATRNANDGDLTTLTTDLKGNLVAAINEVDANADTNAANLATETTNRIADVDAEEARAIAAEGVLTDNLAAEVTRATDAETVLTTNLANEVTARTDADSTLQTNIDNEATARTSADNTLQSNLDAEAATRALNDGSLAFDASLNTEEDDGEGGTIIVTPTDLTDAINKENARAKTAEAGIQADVDANEAASTATNDDLQTQITAEVTRATDAEGILDTKIDTAVANLIDGAPAMLDTLNELAAAIGDDENFVTTVATDIASAKAELKGVATEAMDTMGEIETRINELESAGTAKDDAQDAAIAQEIADREAADTLITNTLTTETTNRTNADAAIQAELDVTQVGAGLGEDGTYTADTTTNYLTTAVSLTDADKKLDAQAKVQETNLANEVTARTDADNTLQSNLDAEAATRLANDNTLQDNINAEATTRGNADTALQTNIDNEAATRLSADNALDARITTVEDQVNGNIGELTDLTTDDKSNLVAAINEVDLHADTNAANLATEIADRTTAVSNEESSRVAADNALQTELDASQVGAGLETDGTYTAIGAYDETTNTTGGHYIGTAANLKDADKKLDAAVKVNTDGLATEVTNRTNADTALQTNLDTETASRIAADNTLTADLASEVTRATGAEADLLAAIQTETTRATTAEGNLGFNAALQVDDGEGGTRLAANLTEAVNAEVARASASETTLTNDLSAEATTRAAADNTLQTNIDNEVTRATTAETTLTNDLATEVSRATTAETTLQTNIDNEATTRATNDTTLQSNIDAEASTRNANDGTLVFNAPLAEATNLTDAINAELLRATNAETALQTNIDNEVARATGAETTLTTDLATETARAIAAEIANTDAITALDAATDALVGNLGDLTTDDQANIVAAINEVQAEADINNGQTDSIKAFINSMLAQSGKTVDAVSLIANTEYSIDVTDLASTNVAVTIYSVEGTVLSQEYGMFIDIDTTNGLVKITSSIDVTAKVVIASDISGLTIA